jgi:hypothetical protein
VRLVLPILPALAASSPVMDGRVTGVLDNRLEVYRTNATRIPRMTGAVIPELLWDGASYRRAILEPLQTEVAALDGEGLLEGEWLNARGRDRTLRPRRRRDPPARHAGMPGGRRGDRLGRRLRRARSVQRALVLGAAQRAFAVEPLCRAAARLDTAGSGARVADPAYARALGWTRAALPTPASCGRA